MKYDTMHLGNGPKGADRRFRPCRKGNIFYRQLIPATTLEPAMSSQTPFAFASRFQLSTADFQLFRTNSFRLIQFRKNASANPLESHTFKTKDLKPFRFTHFQKSGGGGERFLRGPICSARAFLASPDSIGRGGGLPSIASSASLARVTSHESRVTASRASRNDMIFGPPSGRATEVRK
jgi:hypothetical protein